jgi:hypothetical protein
LKKLRGPQRWSFQSILRFVKTVAGEVAMPLEAAPAGMTVVAVVGPSLSLVLVLQPVLREVVWNGDWRWRKGGSPAQLRLLGRKMLLKLWPRRKKSSLLRTDWEM